MKMMMMIFVVTRLSALYTKVLKRSKQTESVHSYIDHYEDVEVGVDDNVMTENHHDTRRNDDYDSVQQVQHYMYAVGQLHALILTHVKWYAYTHA